MTYDGSMIESPHDYALDDDAWRYTRSAENGTVLEAVAWVLSGWSVDHPNTDKLLFNAAYDFMIRLRGSQHLSMDRQ